MTYLVPTLALNEVFIGESLSARYKYLLLKYMKIYFKKCIIAFFGRVSYYQMSVDDGRFFKQKSSGIIVCTGNRKLII